MYSLLAQEESPFHGTWNVEVLVEFLVIELGSFPPELHREWLETDPKENVSAGKYKHLVIPEYSDITEQNLHPLTQTRHRCP